MSPVPAQSFDCERIERQRANERRVDSRSGVSARVYVVRDAIVSPAVVSYEVTGTPVAPPTRNLTAGDILLVRQQDLELASSCSGSH